MVRPNTIQLNYPLPIPEVPTAASFACPRGVAVVEMLPQTGSVGEILLPERVAADLRPDVGTVLFCGPDVDVQPGWLVGVRPYDGLWIRHFQLGDYRAEGEVRVYGHYADHRGNLKRSLWHDSLVIRIDPESHHMTALNHNLIVRRERAPSSAGALHLPQSLRKRSGIAQVVSIGPRCDLETRLGSIQVGDTVHYDTLGELDFLYAADPDLAVIPDVAINFAISR